MENVAIYNEFEKDYITVFGFSEQAIQKIFAVCELNNINIKRVTAANKPGALRFHIYTSKSFLNEALNG